MDKPKQKPIEPLNEVPTAEIIAKEIYPDVECYLDQIEHDRTQWIRGYEYCLKAMQEHTNLHLDNFAELLKDKMTYMIEDDNCIDLLLTEYKLKNKLG